MAPTIVLDGEKNSTAGFSTPTLDPDGPDAPPPEYQPTAPPPSSSWSALPPRPEGHLHLPPELGPPPGRFGFLASEMDSLSADPYRARMWDSQRARSSNGGSKAGNDLNVVGDTDDRPEGSSKEQIPSFFFSHTHLLNVLSLFPFRDI